MLDLIEDGKSEGRKAMKLYLVQHGEALPNSKDPERPLTERGRDDVTRMAAFARRIGVEAHQIRHSGKRRAVETAAILAEHLKPAGGLVFSLGLAPKDDVRLIAEFLSRESQPLMFVGHRPFMDRLVGLLVAGSQECTIVRFAKGGIVCLEQSPKTRTWSILWAVTPNSIP